jgi:carboxypeptidase family protein
MAINWRGVPIAPIIVLLALSLGGTSAAQSANGSIAGTIKDETGATLPGVTGTLTSPALQVPQMVTISEAGGDYRFPELPPGVFRLTYELSGFATLVREDIRLTTGFAARVDVVMKVATVAETVTVSGQSPLVDVTNTRGGTTVSSEILASTPNSLTMQDVFMITGGIPASGTPKNGEGGVKSQGPIATTATFGQSLSGLATYQTLDGVLTFANQYPDFASLEEADIRTYANTAEVSDPGYASILIVKSGGNDFHGSVRTAYQNQHMQAQNVDAALRAQGITQTRLVKYLTDDIGELGGRFIRNKVWFYGAYHYTADRTYVPGFLQSPGPAGNCPGFVAFNTPGGGCWNSPLAASATDLSQQLDPTVKVSWQATPDHKFTGFWAKNTIVENDYTGAKFVPFESTFDYSQPFPTAKGEWQGTLGKRLFVSALFGWHAIAAYRTPQPCCASEVPTFDMATQQVTGSAWSDLRGWRKATRHQLSGTLNYLPSDTFLGSHQLTGGWGYVPERFDINFPVPASGGYRLVFNNGVPAQLWTNSTPGSGTASQNKGFAYVSDSWRVSKRLTANLGLRWDDITANVPQQVKLPGPWPFAHTGTFPATSAGDWKALAPRLGLAFDLSGDGKTVVKATWSRYNHDYPYGFVGGFNPNYISDTIYRWTDPTQCSCYVPGTVNLDPNGPDVLSITGTANLIPNPNLQLTHTNEVTASLERELPDAISVRALYVYKQQVGAQVTVNTLRPYSVYNQQLVRQDPGPDGKLGTADDGGLITFYDYDPGYRGSSFVANTLVNATNRVDNYKNLELSLNKRQSGKWFAQTSFVVTKNHRWIAPVLLSPNSNLFTLDQTWLWQYRLTAGYQVPYGILISTIYQGDNGVLGQRTVNFTGAPSSGTINIPVEPFGADKGPTRSVVNLRISKQLPLGRQKLSVNADIFNLLNTNVAWTRTYVSGPTFDFATDFAQSRVLRLGATLEF